MQDKRNEIESVCKKYTLRFEECTEDYIKAHSEEVNQVKEQIGKVKTFILSFASELPDEVKSSFPSYLLRKFPATL